ncbi:MAG: HTH-type transcriptional repressor FabR [Psittacicella sp.]
MTKISIRDQKRELTRKAIIAAGFNQLSAEKGFSNISLRGVTKQAKISPASFYHHFSDMNELGLVMVDEAGLILRQLLRQARKRIIKGGNTILISVHLFFEFIKNNPNTFRLLLRESSGTSQEFRAAVAREIKHFIEELAEYMTDVSKYSFSYAYEVSEGMVILAFSSGASILDLNLKDSLKLQKRLIRQLFMIIKGANLLANKS